MEYRAVMRCPSCGSSDTKVACKESGTIRAGAAFDVAVVWTCGLCKLVFKPSDKKVLTPILMCLECHQPQQHRLEGRVERKWREPNGTEREMANKIFLEVYRCECGARREYGFANL